MLVRRDQRERRARALQCVHQQRPQGHRAAAASKSDDGARRWEVRPNARQAERKDPAEAEPPSAVTASDRKTYLQQRALQSGLSASFRQELAKRPMRTSWGREMRERAVMMLQTM